MHATIDDAQVTDAAEILALQKLCYQREAEIYQDFSIPPLHQTLERLRSEFGDHLLLKATDGARIVGSVRAILRDGTCHIGRLTVHPDRQNQGLGTALMQAIESRFPLAERFELFTGHRSEKNLHLYTKLGYRAFRAMPVSDRMSLVFLEKARPHP
jgi:ribosomal protein S18 acetylase RimI-like enzyme